MIIKRKTGILIVWVVFAGILLVAGTLLLLRYNRGMREEPIAEAQAITTPREYLIAISELAFSNPDSAKTIAISRLSEFEKSGTHVEKIPFHNIIGIAHLFQSDYNQALFHFYRSLELAIQADLELNEANANNNIGLVFLMTRKYKDALDFFSRALDLYIALDEHTNRASAMNNIGYLYFQVDELDMAYSYYKQAFQIYLEHNFHMGLSSVANHIAQYHGKIGHLDSAFHYFSKAVRYGKTSKNIYAVMSVYLEKAKFLLKTESYEEALRSYYISDSLAKEMRSPLNSGFALLGVANAYLKLEDTDKALKYTEWAAGIAENQSSGKLIYESNEVFSRVYEAKGDINKAFEYYKLSEEQRSQLFDQTELSQLYNLEIDNLRRQMELKELESEKQRMALLKRQNVLLLVVVVAIFLVIIMSLLYYSYINKMKQRQKDRQNEERLKHSFEKKRAIMETEINERRRLGSDLHDGIGTLLSLTKLNLTNILESPDYSPQKKAQLINNTVKNIDEVLREVKHISYDINPQILIEKGFRESVKDLVTRVNQLKKYKIDLSISGLNGELEPYVAHALYRTMQEVITNVVKHADCSEVQVQILQDQEEVTVMIEDNGKGFEINNPAKNNGQGLKNAVSRIGGINGQLLIDSVRGRGTLVTIIVPLSNN